MSTDRETARELAHRMEAYYSDCPGPHPEASGHSFSCDRLAAAIEAREAALRSQLTEARERCACQEHSVLVQLENLVTDVRGERDTARAALAQAEAERDEARRERDRLSGRRFPVLDDARYSVPWSIVAPFEGQAQRNHDQSLEKLASRGGLSSLEMIAVIEGRGCHWVMEQSKAMTEAQARERVFKLLGLDSTANPSLAAEVARLQGELAEEKRVSSLRESAWHAAETEIATARASLVAESRRSARAVALLASVLPFAGVSDDSLTVGQHRDAEKAISEARVFLAAPAEKRDAVTLTEGTAQYSADSTGEASAFRSSGEVPGGVGAISGTPAGIAAARAPSETPAKAAPEAPSMLAFALECAYCGEGLGDSEGPCRKSPDGDHWTRKPGEGGR